MKEPRWLSGNGIRAIHHDQIRHHGGSPGLRDTGLLESALEHPRNRFHCHAEADVESLAAAYGFGIAGNHPFMDGNKRVAFQAMYVFLALNGRRIIAREDDVVRMMLALAAGEFTELKLAAWLHEHTSPSQ